MPIRKSRFSPRRWPARTSAAALVLTAAGVYWQFQADFELQPVPADSVLPGAESEAWPTPAPGRDPQIQDRPAGAREAAPKADRAVAPREFTQDWQLRIPPRVQWAPPADMLRETPAHRGEQPVAEIRPLLAPLGLAKALVSNAHLKTARDMSMTLRLRGADANQRRVDERIEARLETLPRLAGETLPAQERIPQGAPVPAEVLAGEVSQPVYEQRLVPRVQTAPGGATLPQRITRPSLLSEIVIPDERTPVAPLQAADWPSPNEPSLPHSQALALHEVPLPQAVEPPRMRAPQFAAEETVEEEERSDAIGPALTSLAVRLDIATPPQSDKMIAPALPLNLRDARGLRATLAVLETKQLNDEPPLMTSQPRLPIEPITKTSLGSGGLTIVSKGDSGGRGRFTKSPAELLGLDEESRTSSAKCLTSAIYFEARGEPISGQIAVAQVVLNRAFSGFYPRDICGVVYQNKERRHACQFSFACDGKPDAVTEPDAWSRAERIARDMLDGRLWIEDVGKSTHYHAYWVSPWWTQLMKAKIEIGVHTFYRPANWGDGARAPSWGASAAPVSALPVQFPADVLPW
jgi:hypothetical protein